MKGVRVEELKDIGKSEMLLALKKMKCGQPLGKYWIIWELLKKGGD